VKLRLLSLVTLSNFENFNKQWYIKEVEVKNNMWAGFKKGDESLSF